MKQVSDEETPSKRLSATTRTFRGFYKSIWRQEIRNGRVLEWSVLNMSYDSKNTPPPTGLHPSHF